MFRKLLEVLVTSTLLKIREVDYRRPFHRSQTVIVRWK
jgi:hypothetical protein